MTCDICFQPAMVILSKFSIPCGYLLEVLLQYLSVKIQMAFFNTFSGMKGIRRPNIQLIPAKSAKEIDQIIIIIHA